MIFKKLTILISVFVVTLTTILVITTVVIFNKNDVQCTFQNGNTTLSANLWIPSGQGPFPAIVIVHGAGKITSQDYKYLSFFFVQNGFATLTYDKRGVGNSSGIYKRVDVKSGEKVLEDLSMDVVAGVEFLKNNARIDKNRIGLFGVSQGGWIAPLAAKKSSFISFIALYSGPVSTVGQEMYYSGITGAGPGFKIKGISLKMASDKASDFSGPHGFDPIPSLKTIDIPGLWMFGSQDPSTPVALSVKNLTTLVKQHNKDFSYIVYPNANHSLRDVDTGYFFPAMNDALKWILSKFDMNL
jgi:dipeptidyl aminopeptidase/acylaminoacyl peptidase